MWNDTHESEGHTNTEIGPQSSTCEQLRGVTIAALILRLRLDNFVGVERIEHAANAHEAVRTLLRSWHTRRLPQRHVHESNAARQQRISRTARRSAAAASAR